MFLKAVAFLLFLVGFANVALANWSEQTSDSCGNNHAFNATIWYSRRKQYKTFIDGCVMDLNIAGIRLTTNVPSFGAKVFSNMPRLLSIYVSGKDVYSLEPGFLRNTPNLKSIYMDKNRIKSIEWGVFNGLNLELLNLNSNGVDVIHAAAFANFNATLLELENNELTQIFGNWFHKSWIKELNLNYNKITSVDKHAFIGVRQVEVKQLKYNKIYFIDDRTFSAQTALRSLRLTGNFLNSVNFLNHTTIERVDLDFNLYNSISLGKFMKINEIYIYPNPWNCKCLFEFWKYAWKHKIWYGQSFVTDSLVKNNPICIARGDCDRNSIDLEVHRKYFEIVNYNHYG